jgi:prepilin signal peptidase PulO-like enzyme (type II secretory pathway)
MGYLTSEILKKPTFFSILSIIAIIIGIPYGIYGLTLNGGASLGGVLILIGVFIAIIILAIDRGIVSKVKPLKLTIIEILFSIILILIYQYREKEIIVNLENYKENYFVVIYNNGKLKNSEIVSKMLFDKKCNVEKDYVVIPNEIKSEYKTKIISPKKWKSMEMRYDTVNNYRIEFYNSDLREINEEEIKVIVKNKIENNN